MNNQIFKIGQSVMITSYDHTIFSCGRKSQLNIGDAFDIKDICENGVILSDDDYNFIHRKDVTLVSSNTNYDKFLMDEYFALVANTGLHFDISTYVSPYGEYVFIGKNIVVSKIASNVYRLQSKDDVISAKELMVNNKDHLTTEQFYLAVQDYDYDVIEENIKILKTQIVSLKKESELVYKIDFVKILSTLMGWDFTKYVASGIGYGEPSYIVFCDDSYENIKINISDLAKANPMIKQFVEKFEISDNVKIVFCDASYYVDNII